MIDNEKSTELLATSVLSEASLSIRADSISNILQRLDELGLQLSNDYIIDWLPKNQNHPRNWPLKRKLANTACIFLLDTFGALLESGGLVAATQAAKEYGISQTQSLIAFSLMYGIGGALGSIIFPPYSEAFGRKPIIIGAALMLPLSCIITGLVPSIAGAYIGRFIMGATLSIPSTINVGSLEDMWEPATQGHAIYAWVLSAGLGAALGPIYGTYVTSVLGWRWLYHIGSIGSTCILVVLLLGISETRPSKLLGNYLIAIQPCAGTLKLRTQTADDHVPDFHTFCQSAIIQPAKLFFQEPIILTMATLSAIAFSLLFLFTESLDIVFKPYGFSPTSYSLAFIAYAIGMIFGIPQLEPEDKIVGFATGASALAAGLWLMAWTTPPLVHGIDWVVPMIGLAGAGFASNEIEYALGNYLADTYTVYASSAFAAYSILRALLSGIFPLFADQTYNGLGSNIAGSILAGVATLWLISPYIFMKYGKTLREKGKFAKLSLESDPNSQAPDVLGAQIC
ncbi:MFS multidrug transporter [Botrytis cinerea]